MKTTNPTAAQARHIVLTLGTDKANLSAEVKRLLELNADLLAALENLLSLAELRLPAMWKNYEGEPNHILGNAREAVRKAKGL